MTNKEIRNCADGEEVVNSANIMKETTGTRE